MSFCGCIDQSVLERFAKTRWFIAVYSLLGTIQSASSTYFAITLTTIEKRFKIPSQTTGILLSGNEVSQIILSLFLSYYGGQKHIPKWISWGVIASAMSCFILASPHFIYGPGEEALKYTKEYQSIYKNVSILAESVPTKAKDNKLCQQGLTAVDKNDVQIEDFTYMPLYLIFLSQFVLGIGHTLYYSLGPTYIDNNSKMHKTPLRLSYAYAMRILGPIIGYGFGYIFLRIYIAPYLTPLLSPDDTRFLGAWWLGWIIVGPLMFTFAILIRIFPKTMQRGKAVEEHEMNDEKCHQKMEETTIAESEQNIELKDFPKAMKRLLTNRMLMLNTFEAIFWCLSYSGFSFVGRIMEVQFNRSSAKGSIFTGPLTMLGMAAGMLLSGYVVSKYKPSAHLLFMWNVLIGFLYLFSTLSYTQLGCESTNPVLVNGSIVSCNPECFCDEIAYHPVCDRSTDTTYFSPCHAGCRSYDEKLNIYTNCSCSGESIYANRTVSPNACVINCDFDYYAYSLISTITSFTGLFGMMGNILLNFRAVDKKDKALVQGFSLFTVSLAMIPGPIIFGRIIDSTCLVWNKTKNGRKGNCLLYDPVKFRYYLHSGSGFFIVIGVFFDFWIWYYGRHMDLYGDESDENTERIEKETQDSPESQPLKAY